MRSSLMVLYNLVNTSPESDITSSVIAFIASLATLSELVFNTCFVACVVTSAISLAGALANISVPKVTYVNGSDNISPTTSNNQLPVFHL